MKKEVFLLSFGVLYACGNELSEPKSVDITDLQPVTSLEPLPGDRKIVLKFDAANNEEDFSGFNIFRIKEGKTFNEVKTAFNLSLVNVNDPHIYTGINIDDNARKALAQYFHKETAEEDCAVDSKGAETSTKLCPYARCYADSGECKRMEKPEKKAPSNGTLYFVDDKVENGKEYTYLVVPTLKEGKRMASMTSQVVRIRPRKTYTFTNGTTLKSFGIEIKAEEGNTLALQEIIIPKVAGKDEYCLVTPKKGVDSVHFYFDTINEKIGPTSSGGARWATLGSPQDENGNPLQKEWNSVDFLLGTNSLVHQVGEGLSATENSQDTMKKVGKNGYADCGKTGALRPYSRYSIALPDGKYAVLYTGEGQGEDFDVSKFKLVIGETAEDLRL